MMQALMNIVHVHVNEYYMYNGYVTLLVIVDDGCTCGDGNAGIDTIIIKFNKQIIMFYSQSLTTYCIRVSIS